MVPAGDDRAAQPRDPLILPYIYDLAGGIRSGRIIPGERPTISGMGSVPTVPHTLTPFVMTRDLAALVDAVRRDPTLYGHPVVWQQTLHLLNLLDDDDAWARNGWLLRWEDGMRDPRPPHEIEVIQRLIEDLISAHARSCRPSRRIVWRDKIESPGPDGGLDNNNPADNESVFVGADELFDDWSNLHQYFKANKRSLRIGNSEPLPEDVQRIEQLAMRALEASQIRWSGFYGSSGGEPPAALPLDQHASWRLGTWLGWRVDLHPAAQAFVHRCLSPRLLNDGHPAALAYSVLATLLGAECQRVRDVIQNYRQPQRRPKRRASRRRAVK